MAGIFQRGGVAGHAYNIPAEVCYNHTPSSNGILLFDANNCYSAQGSPAFVQSCSHDNGFEDVSSINCVFGSPLTNGNAVVCGLWWGSGDTLSNVTDGSNTYTINSATTTGNGSTINSAYTSNITGSRTTLTATFSAASNIVHLMACHEVSGIATTSPLDSANASYQQNAPHGTNGITTSNVTTTADGDYIFGYMVDSNAQGDPTSAGTGYTLRASQTGNGDTGRSEDQIQTAAGPISATFSDTGTGFPDVLVMIMTFKAR